MKMNKQAAYEGLRRICENILSNCTPDSNDPTVMLDCVTAHFSDKTKKQVGTINIIALAQYLRALKLDN